MQQRLEPVKLFDSKAATWSTVAFPVSDRQHVFLTKSSSGTSNYTIKVQVSNSYNAPDFSAAASKTNVWSYVQIKELITNTAIDWATGFTEAGADAVRTFEINTNGQRWLGATITAYSAGSIDLILTAKNNG